MKIFWDTNLFIYLWERKSFVAEMDMLTTFIETGAHTLVTSTLSVGEILVHPSRSGNAQLVAHYQKALQNLTILPFDTEAAFLFAKLRARHNTIRPPDAIQLSCALAGHCDLFLSNDERLTGLELPRSMAIESLRNWSAAQRPTS